MGDGRPLHAASVAVEYALHRNGNAANGGRGLGRSLREVIQVARKEVGGRNLVERGGRNGRLDPINQDAGIVHQRRAQPVHIQLEESNIGGLAPKADHGRGAATGAAIGPFRAGQFLDDALVEQVLHDGGDAGMAEAGHAGQNRARLRPARAQRGQQQPPILTADAITVADGSRQAPTSPTPML